MTFLQIKGLRKLYGPHVGVHNIDLTVEKGEFVSLLGPSGCGKTTALQMIAGFIEPTDGDIAVDGVSLARVPPAKRNFGIVFQSYALFPHMTAAQNVAFGLEMRKVGAVEIASRVKETLSLVGLDGLGDRYPRRMSGGQQQRVALARALVVRPRLLLLDEPLSNLDAKIREEMQEELRSIQRNVGTTTVLVTHDQGEAFALSDRVIVMNKGRVEQVGHPETAYGNPSSQFVQNFLGRTNVVSAKIIERDGSYYAVF
ncbi:ABC transporter ATP-binding protein, partial [Escherichia coli]